jgi:hypothetical protein
MARKFSETEIRSEIELLEIDLRDAIMAMARSSMIQPAAPP